MFLYITGIKSEVEALAAIEYGANAIGVELGYRKNALEAESCRTWLEKLPFHVLKSGIFQDEEYYAVEEIASFCHLDIIHLASIAKANDFGRHSGRVIIETDICNIKDFKADGYIIKLVNPDDIKLIKAEAIAKPLLLTGKFSIDEWSEILDEYKPTGLSIDFSCLNQDFIKFINKR